MPTVDADVLVLAGDIHTKDRGLPAIAEWATSRPTIYVAGNHEFYGAAIPKLYETLIESTKDTQATTFLQNTSTVISGTRFLGCTLWTDFALIGDDCREMAMLVSQTEMTDYKKIRVSPQYRRLTPGIAYSYHRRSISWLETELEKPFDGKTVVVTHHAPSALSVNPAKKPDAISASYASCLDDFILRTPVDLWIHGHTHRSVDYQIGRTRIISNQRGYPGEDTGFDPAYVVTL
jgi:predicted phosphodiesterase